MIAFTYVVTLGVNDKGSLSEPTRVIIALVWPIYWLIALRFMVYLLWEDLNN